MAAIIEALPRAERRGLYQSRTWTVPVLNSRARRRTRGETSPPTGRGLSLVVKGEVFAAVHRIDDINSTSNIDQRRRFEIDRPNLSCRSRTIPSFINPTETMGSTLGFVNRLLPFATPGTPLLQDLVHLATLCAALYFAPQIQHWYQQRQIQGQLPVEEQPLVNAPPEPPANENGVEPGENAPDDTDIDLDDRPVDPNDHNDFHDDEHNAEPQPDAPVRPGPANLPDLPPARNVGAKKAKALAKKDQRRAYHEFQRSQGEAQRARDAEGAAERDSELASERERRRGKEAALEERKAREREVKREVERRAREEEIRKREAVVRIVRESLEEGRVCDLMGVARRVGADVDVEWVEKIVVAGGIVGRKGGVVTMVTGMGWVVRVTEEDMEAVYRRAVEEEVADEEGRIGFDLLGRLLQDVLVRP
ncbi:hypothetical protein LTR91_005496 [Friedmanniomyces endolithicus]|uniref:Uncharacterized protein n=1 Tax=Friedmanniomyces endolithicus TaxID=329885 RepID=A0AAN6KUT9_9PEZI|nr:hypothetical protein LTR35_008467 [Friedmanniomyces endolithicus]KAK0294782.1 hypothetical protein LTS00_006617 [Friedmanniomyces endolithicus]KAK0306399.1 hypothetical protein LTR01_006257 [Friedmanniomyces endolithicus]KAK0322481.1 hypothetical protein LTR82_006440 [Friedmanniomyces endolithicus]KAK0824987.1 hypothetical protein LTR73_007274 [Friedmanniomyces endolithicus]